MRNSLRGVARDMLIPLGENALVDDIRQKLDGFFGNVATTQTLMQSFCSDCQKEDESIVSFGSRLEHTLSRAIEPGHINSIAKDAMLCSKFWTGLKSQTLKNSTSYLYSNVSDFQTLLKEIAACTAAQWASFNWGYQYSVTQTNVRINGVHEEDDR